jgi:preprotein translocase subunit SecF
MRTLASQNFNFIRWRWHAIALSVLIIAVGLWVVVKRGGLPLGIDFSGGTVVELKFAQPVGEEAVRGALAPVVKDPVVQQIGQAGQNKIMIRLPMVESAEKGANLEDGAKLVEATLRAAKVGEFTREKVQIVGPVIGKDLQRKGIYATVFSLIGIMTYIALRFRLSFGVGAAVASVHDVLVTLAILTLSGYELSLNVIAAILTLTGYGVNDQIVVFDRVRENLRLNRRDPMDVVINQSVNQTLPRTVITAGVTFLAVLALYLFGGDVLEGFSFAMLVGIITSTYSTIYIASAVAVVLSPKRLRAGGAPGTAGAAKGAAPVKAGGAPAKTGGAAAGSKSSRRSS